MTELRVGLIADGSSDRCLLRLLTWSLRQSWPGVRLAEPVFDLHLGGLDEERLEQFRSRHRVGLLFVHRDAENATIEDRKAEIPTGLDAIVPVIPTRMTEAWLLIDERAIRVASGNPNGTMPLVIPPVKRLEDVSDPKSILRTALVEASGLAGPRRRSQFRRDLSSRIHRVAAEIQDYSVLRELRAFRAFERDLEYALTSLRGESDAPR
ncbi:MAG: hypothetical protein ACF8XB_12670 [Planctomycetota bacterium JB042]